MPKFSLGNRNDWSAMDLPGLPPTRLTQRSVTKGCLKDAMFGFHEKADKPQLSSRQDVDDESQSGTVVQNCSPNGDVMRHTPPRD